MNRRRVLAGAMTGAALLAGCSALGGDSDTNTTSGGGDDGQSPTDAGFNTRNSTPTAVGTTVAESAGRTATGMVTSTRSETATSTAMPTSTATATATATSASTATATPLATSQATARTTGGGTIGPGTTFGAIDVDLSNRETYTNDVYSYTIEYPGEWRIDESDPAAVSFTAPASISDLTVYAQGGYPRSVPLGRVVRAFLRGYRQSTSQSGVGTEVLDRRRVSLANDLPAVLLDLRASASSGVSIRQEVLITVTNRSLYAPALTLPESAYTSTVESQTEALLTSLTVDPEATPVGTAATQVV